MSKSSKSGTSRTPSGKVHNTPHSKIVTGGTKGGKAAIVTGKC